VWIVRLKRRKQQPYSALREHWRGKGADRMLKRGGEGVDMNIEIWKSFVGSVRKFSGWRLGNCGKRL
jgi:hypothetical protein